jgi:hypothetical protein
MEVLYEYHRVLSSATLSAGVHVADVAVVSENSGVETVTAVTAGWHRGAFFVAIAPMDGRWLSKIW